MAQKIVKIAKEVGKINELLKKCQFLERKTLWNFYNLTNPSQEGPPAPPPDGRDGGTGGGTRK